MGRYGRTDAETNFTWDRIAQSRNAAMLRKRIPMTTTIPETIEGLPNIRAGRVTSAE
jgi:hypothetical protein